MAAPGSTGGKPPDPSPPLLPAAAAPGSLSFAAAVRTSKLGLRPRFPPLSLPVRQVSSKEGRPAISFTGAEVSACERRFGCSLVAKFTVGRPPISEIQTAFQQSWSLAGRASISAIFDARHVLIILDSEEDVRVALACKLNKVGHALFRIFRWSSDYNPKNEPKYATVWVRLPDIPLSIYDSSFIGAIVSTFGYFVDVDLRTKACASVQFARACVELDVTQPIPDAIWVALPNDKGYWQSVVVESKLLYCSNCRLHGHNLSSCKKVKSKEGFNKDVSKVVQGKGGIMEAVKEHLPKRVVVEDPLVSVKEWQPVIHRRRQKKVAIPSTADRAEPTVFSHEEDDMLCDVDLQDDPVLKEAAGQSLGVSQNKAGGKQVFCSRPEGQFGSVGQQDGTLCDEEAGPSSEVVQVGDTVQKGIVEHGMLEATNTHPLQKDLHGVEGSPSREVTPDSTTGVSVASQDADTTSTQIRSETEIVPSPSPVDVEQSSNSAGPTDPRCPPGMRFVNREQMKEMFNSVKHFMAEEGVVEFPERVDDSYIEKYNRALEKSKGEKSIIDSEHSPPISEWCPVKKKRKDKGKLVIGPLEVRRTSRASQSSKTRNSDFIYQTKRL